MFNGYRRYIVATVGIFVLAVGSATLVQYLDYVEAQQLRPHEKMTAAPRHRSDLARVADALEAIVQDNRSAEQEERSRRDLNAQEGAWRWARWGAWAAFIQLILSGTGIAFVILSLKQTNKSLAEAREANRIATQANAEAVKQALAAGEDTQAALSITRNAERAHVVVSSVSLRANKDGGNIKIRFGWVIHNTGRTPGYVVKVPLSVAIGGLPDDGPTYGLSPITSRLFVSNANPLNNDNIDAGLSLTMAAYDSFLSGDLEIFLFGVVIYDDVFDKRHSSGFCYKITGRNGGIFTNVVTNADYWTTT